MVHILLNVDGFARSQAHHTAGRDGVSTAVGMDGDVGFVVNFFVGQAVVHLNQHIAAAHIDDILGFVPVEMVGRILALFQVQQLFGVDLGVLVAHLLVAVAQGNQGEAHLVKVTQTVVGDVPAQHAVADFVILMADFLPLFRSEMAERRQLAAVLFAHSLQLFQCFVDFGSFHELLGEMGELGDGVYQMSDLRYGKYLVREKTAPAGFLLDENVYPVSIEEDGKVYTVENEAGVGFINAAQKGSLKIVKTSSDKKVEGFSFRVTGTNGYDQTFKTDQR